MALLKTNGAELKKFWASEDPAFWPDESHVDGMFYEVNGVEKEDIDVETLADTDIIKVEGAIIHHNGDDFDFAGVMKKWRKAQTMTQVVVEVPTLCLDSLKTHMKFLKGRVL